MATIQTNCEIKYIYNVYKELFRINNVSRFLYLLMIFIIATPMAYIIILQSNDVRFICLVLLFVLVYTLAYIKCRQWFK